MHLSSFLRIFQREMSKQLISEKSNLIQALACIVELDSGIKDGWSGEICVPCAV